MLDWLFETSLLKVGQGKVSQEIKDISGFLTSPWAAAVPNLGVIDNGILRL